MTSKELNERAAAARRWWSSLGPIKLPDGRQRPGDRAALARLRRCSSVIEAAAEPAVGKLFRALEFDPKTDARHIGRVAVLAAVLAHVRKNDERKISIAIGAPRGGEASEAVVKPNRFRALMAARTEDEILTLFRRVVAMLGDTANVRDLARLILGWTDDEAGDRARIDFAFAYHGAADFSPDSDDSSDTDITKTPTP